MKAQPSKAGSLSKTLKGAVKAAGKAVKAVKAAANAKPAKASAPVAPKHSAAQKQLPLKAGKPGKAASVVETVVATKGAKAGKGKQSTKSINAAAAAVERVTERLMGRLTVEPTFDTVCREVACEGLGTSAGYCRLHYIKNWKKIKRKEVILKEGKLNQYIEELVAKYPEKYIEAIRQDLANDKEFAKVIVDLDLEENDDDFESESSGDADTSIDSIKRDFEDESDAF
jgi:hypothetical protein